MKLLVSSMTFAPDHSGIALYATDFATYAAEQGHDVTVVTGFSWYPKWAKAPEDRRKLFQTDSYKGTKVLRGYLYVPKRVSTITRIVQEISFILFAFANFLRAGKQDAIVIFTTPINLGVVGALFKKIWGAKLLINVQDLQLDAAKSLGMLSKLPIVDVMNRIEKYSYNKSSLVTSISSGMIRLISAKGVEEKNIYLWPNWINVAEAHSKGVKGDFRKKFPAYGDKIIIGYAGNVGVKQGLSVLVDLAGKFEQHSELVFLIIGQGGDVDNLKEYAQQVKAKNLHFIDFLSQEDYFNFLTDASIIFISQKKDSGDVYFPSKLLGIMAKEKLVFVAADADSEVYKVIAGNQLGVAADYGATDLLANQLRQYLSDAASFEAYKHNAYQYVQQFDREYVLSNVLNRLETLQPA